MTIETMRGGANGTEIPPELKKKHSKLFFELTRMVVSALVSLGNLSTVSRNPINLLEKRVTCEDLGELVDLGEAKKYGTILPEKHGEIVDFLIKGIVGTLTKLNDPDSKELDGAQGLLSADFKSAKKQGFTVEKIQTALEKYFSQDSQRKKRRTLITGNMEPSEGSSHKLSRQGSKGGTRRHLNRIKLVLKLSSEGLSPAEISEQTRLKSRTIERYLRDSSQTKTTV